MIGTIKTTILGGIFFLVPFGILLLVGQEVLNLALLVASPLAEFFPADDLFGIAMASVLAWILVLSVCYVVGRISTMQSGKFSVKLDNIIANLVPGYRLMKSRMAGLLSVEDTSELLEVVEVHQGNAMRWAFEVERSKDGKSVLVFYPGVPNPNAGTLQVVPVEQVRKTMLSPAKVVEGHHYFGRGLLQDLDADTPHSQLK